MANGPSKQDLEMYWQSSRQYFDELAKYYQQADPAYYKEYILPFYNNPFSSTYSGSYTTGRKTSGARPLAVIAGLLVLLIAGLAVFVFIFVGSEDTGTKEIEKLFSPEENKDTKTTEPEKKIETNKDSGTLKPQEVEEETEPGELSSEDNFIVGSKYIGEKKYDKAEYHLKKVKPGSKYYQQAQQLLQNMKYLRQYNK